MLDWPVAVLFDFDGVIANSEPLHCQGFMHVLAGEGVALSEEEYYREMIGFDDRGAFLYILGKHRRPAAADDLARLIERKSRFVDTAIREGRFAALPGVEQFVRRLHRRGCGLAICSGALRHEIESMLQGIGLREFFPVIIAAEDVAVGKPDPGGYLLAARLVGEQIGRPLQPQECLIIEDAPTVIRSVRAAGFRVAGVATTYPLEQLTGADWAVPSLAPADLSRIIPALKLPE